MENACNRCVVAGFVAVMLASSVLPAATRRPLAKPWVEGASAALDRAAAEAKREVARRPQEYIGAPVYREVGSELNREDAAIVFFWIDENGRDKRLSIPLLGEVDVEIAATVEPESPKRDRALAYSYATTTFLGSRRAVEVITFISESQILSGGSPGSSWKFLSYVGGTPGFSAVKPGWEWYTVAAKRESTTVVMQGFRVTSEDLPGLVKIEVRGDWPAEEMRSGDTRDNEDKPEEMLLAWEKMEPYLGPARGYTLGPDVFPADHAQRLARVSELLTQMSGLGWLDEGEPVTALRRGVDDLRGSLGSASGETIAGRVTAIERLVASLVEKGQAISEVRDFLHAHLVALDLPTRAKE